MTISERTMTVLTLAGLIIAGLTGGIFWKQLKEMRTDQRAWLSITSGVGNVATDPSSGNSTVAIPVTIANTGKTPAKRVTTEVVVEKVHNGDSPEFIYDNRALTRGSTGTIFPGGFYKIEAALLKGVLNRPDQTENILLTPSQFKELEDGTSYIAVYSRTSYVDVFDTTHSLYYRAFATLSPTVIRLTAKRCTDYNDVDND
jgi:hypothetical protein